MKSALVALLLTGSAAAPSVKLVEKSGAVWTIRSVVEHTGGQYSQTTHHLLRNGKEVTKVDAGSAIQSNPTMSTSTRWTFAIVDGALQATQERYSSYEFKSSTTTITVFTWDGKALVGGAPQVTHIDK